MVPPSFSASLNILLDFCKPLYDVLQMNCPENFSQITFDEFEKKYDEELNYLHMCYELTVEQMLKRKWSQGTFEKKIKEEFNKYAESKSKFKGKDRKAFLGKPPPKPKPKPTPKKAAAKAPASVVANAPKVEDHVGEVPGVS